MCVFNHVKYVEMLMLCLESIELYGNLSCLTKIVVYTSDEFMYKIKSNLLLNKFKISEHIIYEVSNMKTSIDAACKARLDFFSLKSIASFEKILYLDTDILIKGDINIIFNCAIEDTLYVLEEGRVNDTSDYWGYSLFSREELKLITDTHAFTTGILLFNNSLIMKSLFDSIQNDMCERPRHFSCHDQPYIVYNSFKYKLFENKSLKPFAINNDYNIHSDKIIHHFPGGPGDYGHKIVKMNKFLHELTYQRNKMIFINHVANKIFTWGDETIQFLPDWSMNAFGKGSFQIVADNTVCARFGGRSHIIQFNEDYSSFISTRDGDSLKVSGKIYNI